MVPDRDRDDYSGRYTESFSLAEVLKAVEELGGEAGTNEVATEIGSSYETAYRKLHELEDEGEVSSRKVGTALLWRIDA